MYFINTYVKMERKTISSVAPIPDQKANYVTEEKAKASQIDEMLCMP